MARPAKKGKGKPDKADNIKERKTSQEKELEEVRAKVLEGKGNASFTAQLLGIGRSTLYEWMEKHPIIKTWIHEAGEAQIDHVENKLFELINNGEIAATIFYLKTKGKTRGYIERQETHHSGGIELKSPEDLTDAELATIARQDQPGASGKGNPPKTQGQK